ncbi:TPA: hypothetical protein RU013_003698, partial [Vibrio cholerae]|nr:hypothetical protein [Vibrio cholerae]
KFVDNGYKTEADIKRGEELCYTRIALVVTFIGLLASIFIPLYSTTSVDIKNDVIQTSSENATKQYIEQKSQENKALINGVVTELELLSSSLEQKTNSIQRSNAEEIESIRSSIKNLESKIKELSTSVKAHNENAT